MNEIDFADTQHLRDCISRLRGTLTKIAEAGEIHDPHWAGSLAREALRLDAHLPVIRSPSTWG